MKNGWRVPSFLPSCSYSFFYLEHALLDAYANGQGMFLHLWDGIMTKKNGRMTQWPQTMKCHNMYDIAWWIIPWQMCIRNHRPQWLLRAWEGHRTSQDKTCLAGKRTIEDKGCGSAPTCSYQKKTSNPPDFAIWLHQGLQKLDPEVKTPRLCGFVWNCGTLW